MQNFTNRVAVITGAASGLGKAFSDTAAQLGMKLVLGDIRKEALDETVAEFRAAGIEAIGVSVDVSKPEQVQALAEAALEAFGQVNLVFNNAGVSAGGLIWESTPRDWAWILGVNLHGVINGLRSFTPLMLEAAAKDPTYEGHIVNVGSLAGLLMAPAMSTYAVSKHAVVAVSEALYYDLDLVTQQVRCSVLCPSYVPTNIGNCAEHRPEEFRNTTPLTKSQTTALSFSKAAVAAGPLSPAGVSEFTFDGVRNDEFYIIPDTSPMPLVQRRFAAILDRKNPSISFDEISTLRTRREHLAAAVKDERVSPES